MTFGKWADFFKIEQDFYLSRRVYTAPFLVHATLHNRQTVGKRKGILIDKRNDFRIFGINKAHFSSLARDSKPFFKKVQFLIFQRNNDHIFSINIAQFVVFAHLCDAMMKAKNQVIDTRNHHFFCFVNEAIFFIYTKRGKIFAKSRKVIDRHFFEGSYGNKVIFTGVPPHRIF